MSLPWVSRGLYEEAIRQAAEWKASALAYQTTMDKMLEMYHALKLGGAAVPEPKPEARKAPEPDPVTQAILAKAGKSQQLRKHYYEFVNEQRKEGFSDETIAAAILKGQDDMEGVP